MHDPDPKKKINDSDDLPDNNNGQYIEPETIDTQEPEDLDSDEEDV